MSAEGTDARSQRERMLAGALYQADDPELAAASARAQLLADRFNASAPPPDPARATILAELIGQLGDDVEIRPPLRCDYGSNLRIGARTFINFGLMALDVAVITIGQDVQIGPNVQLLTPTHPLDPELRRAKWEAAEPITIGDNVWIGGGAVLLPGVTVGENAVIGAGSVVTKPVPSNTVVAGNPARVLRSL